MKLYTTVEISNLQDSVKVSPLTNGAFYNICKFINNSDSEKESSKFIEESIESLIVNKDIIPKLKRTDKIYLILKLYEKYVDDFISVSCKHKQSEELNSVGIGVGSICDAIGEMSIDYFVKVNYEDIQIQISEPTNIFCDTYDDLMASMIYKIEDGSGNDYYFNSFSTAEKTRFLESIVNIDLFKTCAQAISDNSEPACLISLGNDFEFEDVKAGYFDNTLFAIVKSLFTVNLKHMLENIYVYCKSMGGSHQHFETLTPFEFARMLEIHKSYMQDTKNNSEDTVDF
jgi:hypothetical protein